MRSFAPFFLACFELAFAKTHYLFSGAFAGSTVAGLEYEDETDSLSLVRNISLNAVNETGGSKWISLDSGNKNLYVATAGFFQSYEITSNFTLQYRNNISTSSDCDNPNFIAALTTAPFAVVLTDYEIPAAGCPSLVASVDAYGSLQTVFANVTYDSTAGVHGTSISPDNKFIYSADDPGNAVWTHSYDPTTGMVAELQRIEAPEASHPRHLATHPNGEWVYVVYEESNKIASYKRDTLTGLLSDTNVTYSLLPPGYNSSAYWGDEVLFSVPSSENKLSPKYLIAATRSYSLTTTGYVSAFALDATTGAIIEQIFLLPTTASGGSANAVTPSSFDEETFAITDSGANFIEIWKMNGSSAAPVAHLDTPGFSPANAVWHS